MIEKHIHAISVAIRHNQEAAFTTDALGIADLLALKSSTDSHYFTVHKRYFSDDKLICPACGSTKTRCSKVVKRTFKDILWDTAPTDEGEKRSFRVFDLTFYQT